MSLHDRPSPDRPSDVIDDVAHLLRSPTRVRLLRLLADRGSVHRDELREEFGVARTTLQRNLAALADRGWVRNTGAEYRISPSGRLVAGALGDVLEATLTAVRARAVLRWLPPSALDLDHRHLADAEVVRSTADDPFAPVDRYAAAVEAAERVRAIVSAPGLLAATAAAEPTADADGDRELVLSGSAAASARSVPPRESTARRGSTPGPGPAPAALRRADEVDVLVAAESVPFSLGLLDGTVHLVVADEDGIPRGSLVSDREPVRSWATETYEAVREGADAVDPQQG